MEKMQFFSLLSRWPLVEFNHIKVVEYYEEESVVPKKDLYIHHLTKHDAQLFLCHVPPHRDVDDMLAVYTDWLKDYGKVRRVSTDPGKPYHYHTVQAESEERVSEKRFSNILEG